MSGEPARKRRQGTMQAFALALELPIILVAAPVAGFLVGQWLDERWKTSFLALLLGGIGFVAGIREVLRRIPKGDKEESGSLDEGESKQGSGKEDGDTSGHGGS